MARYELLYIISSDASEEKREQLIEKMRAYAEAKAAKSKALKNGE